MYFLSDEERKHLIKGLLPKSRELSVADELRGWSWNQAPLEPPYETRLALYEVANCYCPTGRDLYLRRVMGVRQPVTRPMVSGRVLHSALSEFLVTAKRELYAAGVEGYERALKTLAGVSFRAVEEAAKDLAAQDQAEIRRKVEVVWQFEATRLAARVSDIVSRQPYIGEDSLVSQAIPIVVEQKLDGTFLGLSANLSADAMVSAEPMILDLKFGNPEKFHKLTTTGYALVMEAIYEYPLNLGCIVYAEFKGETGTRLHITRQFHLIDDELRQWFIETRDQKMRMVFEELDPGRPEQCPPYCGLRKECGR